MIIKQKFTELDIEVKWYCDSIEEIVIVNRICQNLETGLEALLPAPATPYVYVYVLCFLLHMYYFYVSYRSR